MTESASNPERPTPSPAERLSAALKYGSLGEQMVLAYEIASGEVDPVGCDPEALEELSAAGARGWAKVADLIADGARTDDWDTVAKQLAEQSLDSYTGPPYAAALRILAEQGKFDPEALGITGRHMDPHRARQPLELY